MNLDAGSPDVQGKTYPLLWVILLAALLEGIVFYLQHNIDINLADEGYLLYGVVSTAAGKVPLRDFQAYDPGRYLWMAAWSRVFGEGLPAMRFSLAVFGFMGLSFGLLAARRAVRTFWGLVPVGIVLTVWIFPRFHSFEIAFAMATVFFAVRLIESPTYGRYFSAGIFVGLAAFFGRNIGLYGFMALSLTAFYLWLRLDRSLLLRHYARFIAGVLLGYSPIFIMSVFISGFFSSFVDSLLFYMKLGSTNLSLPVPWPWHAFRAGTESIVFFHDFFLGVLFLAMPVFYLLCLVRHFFIRREDLQRHALLTASFLTGLFYMHYVFSRADIEHLARGIHPLILAVTALACLRKEGRARKALAAAAAVFFIFSSYFTVIKESPYYKKNVTQAAAYIEYPIRGARVWLPRGQAAMINTLESAVRARVPENEDLFIAPFIPAMYYILDRESPTWDIYFLLTGSRQHQREIIASLEERNVRWALVGDIPLNGRDDLRFSRSYDLVWRYLRKNFFMVAPLWNTGYVLVRRREVPREMGGLSPAAS